MPIFCVVYSSFNHSDQEEEKKFYKAPKIVICKDEKYKKFTEKQRKKKEFESTFDKLVFVAVYKALSCHYILI